VGKAVHERVVIDHATGRAFDIAGNAGRGGSRLRISVQAASSKLRSARTRWILVQFSIGADAPSGETSRISLCSTAGRLGRSTRRSAFPRSQSIPAGSRCRPHPPLRVIAPGARPPWRRSSRSVSGPVIIPARLLVVWGVAEVVEESHGFVQPGPDRCNGANI
jgi:hypothetical protein